MSYSHPRPIRADDETSKFDCGEPSLNDWLRRFAVPNGVSGTSQTFVTISDSQVIGYYALASASVMRAIAPAKVARRQPEMVPVVLLARLAVDRSHQGRRLGAHLLRDAILRTLQLSSQVGVRALLVHALNEQARDFYLHYQFEPSPTDDLHLFLLLQDVRASLGPLQDGLF